MLTKTMANELAPYRIRVNNVTAGLTETDINRKDIANKEWRDARNGEDSLKDNRYARRYFQRRALSCF